MEELLRDNPELARPVTEDLQVLFVLTMKFGIKIPELKKILARNQELIDKAIEKGDGLLNTAKRVAAAERLQW